MRSQIASSLRIGRSRAFRTIRRLQLENLEPRRLLSASGYKPHYYLIPHASSSISDYTPAQLRAAYGFNNVSFGSTAADGRGQTIAIIDAYNDPNIAADLAAFDSKLGIAAPASFRIVNQNGGASLPGTDPSQGWEGETALDVEWAHAIAPGANILLVEADSASDANLFAAVNFARQQVGVSAISMSWGSDDDASNASADQNLSNSYLVTPGGHQGITFVASSGDDGHPSFPAESPNVLAVGGTDLYLTSSGAITNETAWTPTVSGGQTWSGGGGVSREFAGRKVPDVAYDAGIGMAVYDTFGPDHGWISVGGTSAVRHSGLRSWQSPTRDGRWLVSGRSTAPHKPLPPFTQPRLLTSMTSLRVVPSFSLPAQAMIWPPGAVARLPICSFRTLQVMAAMAQPAVERRRRLQPLVRRPILVPKLFPPPKSISVGRHRAARAATTFMS